MIDLVNYHLSFTDVDDPTSVSKYDLNDIDPKNGVRLAASQTYLKDMLEVKSVSMKSFQEFSTETEKSKENSFLLCSILENVENNQQNVENNSASQEENNFLVSLPSSLLSKIVGYLHFSDLSCLATSNKHFFRLFLDNSSSFSFVWKRFLPFFLPGDISFSEGSIQSRLSSLPLNSFESKANLDYLFLKSYLSFEWDINSNNHFYFIKTKSNRIEYNGNGK